MTYDVIIVGGGPAGATAAIYCARDGKRVLVIEKEIIGGRITESPKVENIPGFISISGVEYGNSLDDQLNNLGVTIEYDTIKNAYIDKDLVYVESETETYCGKALIIATGTKNRVLGLPKEKELIGRNISFCVACDGLFYKGKRVIVIGGGNSALTEAIELSEICKEVTIVQNLDCFTADKVLLDEIQSKQNVNFIFGEKVTEYITDENNVFIGISLSSGIQLISDGVFIAIGQEPQNDVFKNVVDLNTMGYIIASNCETKNKEIFACGDCVANSVQQVATACGSGVIAAQKALKYLNHKNDTKSKLIEIISGYPSLAGDYESDSHISRFAGDMAEYLISKGIKIQE